MTNTTGQGQKRIVIGDAGGNAWRGDWRDAADDCETGMADLKELDEVIVTVNGRDIHLNPAHITSIHWETRPLFVKPNGQRVSGVFSRYADDPRSAIYHRAVIDACVEKDDLPKFSTRLAIVEAVLTLMDSEKDQGAPSTEMSQRLAAGLAPWVQGFRNVAGDSHG